MRKFYFLLIALSFAFVSNAQSSANYTFTTNTTGSLALTSTGTAVDMSTGTTLLLAAGNDDQASSVFNIGFDFYLLGTKYTQFSVNSNGALGLGGTAIGTSGTGTGTTATPVIAAFGGDQATVTASAANSKVHFQLVGTAPNRVLVVEWANMKINYSGYSTATSGNGTYQVLLYETSSAIDLKYGAMNVATTFSTAPVIGFSAGTTAGTIASITSSTNTVATNGTAWVSNTYTTGAITNLNSASDGSRRVYRFVPAIPTAPSALTFSSVGATSMVLNWTDNSSTEYGFGVYKSLDGVTYSLLSQTAANAITLPSTGLTPSTLYYYRVVALGEGGPSSTLDGSQATTACTPLAAGTYSVGPTGTYATVTSALAALTSGTSGAVYLELQSTYTSASETFPIVLTNNACPIVGGVTIRPQTGATGLSISGSNATTLIDFNGGSNFTIDGRPGGTGTTSQLTITNTSTGSAATARFINDASNNTITYCTLQGSASTANGVVTLSGGVTTGNDNNTISYNNITAAGANLPLNGVYSYGTSAAIDNSGNSILNNNIYDIFSAASAFDAINVNSNNSGWSIIGNKIYQTASRAVTTGNTEAGIYVSSGDAYTITGNVIGYASNTATGVMTYTSSVALRYVGIYCTFKTAGIVSNIQGNTIAAISMSTSSGATTTYGIFSGIYVSAGTVNIGTIAGNTIGSQSSTGSITLTSTTTGAIAMGISYNGSNALSIKNNTIGSVTLLGSTTSIGVGLYGIYVSGASTSTAIQNNIVGSTTTANSINSSTISTGSTSQLLYGINVTSSVTTAINISNNTVANLNGASTSTAALVRGIQYAGTGVASIVSNTIFNLASASANTTVAGGATAVSGIVYTGTSTGGGLVSKNTIYNIAATNSSAVSTVAIGIGYSNPTSGVVAQNKIYDIRNASTGTTATAPPMAIGVMIRAAVTDVTVSNNMISLGNSQTTNTQFVGILNSYLNAGPVKVYHNSVNIEGAATSGALPSFCFLRGDNSTTAITTPIDLQNNLFTNTRSGGTGKHYAIGNNYGATASTTGWGANASNYNILNASAANIGYWTADKTFSAWQTSSVSDANSQSGVVIGYTASATADLHITGATSPVEAAGNLIPAVTNDIDDEVRANLTPTDIGADAGNFFSYPTIVYTALTGTCSTASRTITATITDADGVPTSGAGLPVLYWKINSGSYTGVTATSLGSNQYSFSFGNGVAVGNTISYYIVAQDNLGNVGSYPSFGASGLTSTPPAASVAPSAPSSYIINNTIAGTYTVGSAVGAAYPTLTAAINAYNNSCLAGPVVFSLTDATYAETGGMIINNSAASSTNTLTIKPAVGVTASVTAAVASSSVIKVLNNYVTIDGSNTVGGSTKDLTITNSSTTTPSVITVGSTGTTPISNVTVKNTNLINGANSNTAFYVSDGASLGTAGYFNNISFINNSVQKAYIGIYAIAAVATGNGSELVISNNDFTNSINPIRRVGVYVQGVDGATVTNNTIGNFETATAESDQGIWLATGTVNTTVSNNTISTLAYTGASSTIGYGPSGIYVSSGVATSNISITNNTISAITSNAVTSSGNANYSPLGIYVAGTAAVSITGNSVSNVSYTGAGYSGPLGIGVTSGVANSNITILNNIVSGVASNGTISNTTSGIAVFGTGTGGVNVLNNKVSNIKNTNSSGYSAIGVLLASTLTAANITLSNNFINDVAGYGYSSSSTDNGYGINIYSGGGYNIYHNTVNMQTAQTVTSGKPACLIIGSSVTAPASIDLRNNIFANTPTVGTDRYAIISNAANTVFSNIDYNDYYSSGSNIGYISSTNQANLAAVQTSFGGNTKSVSFNPTFVSATDLHLTNTAGANWCLDGKGTPISTVTTDIDGDTRSTTKPDIGADEFNATGFTVTNPAVICAPNTVDLTAAAVTAGSMNGLTFTYFTDAAATTTLTNANAVAASGTYYIKATNGSCSLVYPVTVTINAAPAAFNVTGGGTYCSPGAGFVLGLDGSATGINYQLYNGASAVGSAVAGTGSAISFGAQTAGGTYTVVATDATTSCTATMTGSAVIVNNPKPTAFNVTGTGSYCSGGTGLTVGLDGSEAGIDYQLYLGANPVGSAVAGTGSAISFGVQTTGGTYTVVASNTTTSCTENMTGSAVITVNPVPVISTTLFQPTTCASLDGEIVVTMSGAAGPYTFSWSTTGGNGLVTGAQTQTTLSVGSYTLVAQAANGCSASSTVSLAGPGGCSVCPSVPSVSANMYPVCAGNNFTLSAAGLADMGISYGVKFLYSATALVNPYSGGTAISTVANSSLFANGTIAVTTTSISTPGTYYMYAILSPAPVDPNCRPYAVTQLTIADIPTLSLGANPSVCYSTSASAGTISYTSSVAVSTYNVVWNAAALAAGFTNVTNGTVSGSTLSLPVPAGAAAATYSGTITVSSGSGCASSAVAFSITVNPTPTVDAVSNQTVCNDAATTAITFAGAVTGTTYSWTNSNPAIGLASSGTGNIASFTAVNTGTTPVTSTVTVTPSAFGPVVTPVASPVTINYADRYITYTGVSINGGSNSAIVAAGSSVSLSYNYSVAFDYGTGYCPGCVVQFYVGLGGSNQTLTCVNPIGGGSSGTQSATFTAPSTPGVYYLTQSGTLDYVCQPQAFNNLPSNAIGYIQVGATGCVGAPRTFTITVNPTPTVAAVSNQALCNGLTTTAVAFTGTVTGTTYSWTNSAPSIGLAASGTGNIPAFTAVNTGGTAVTATITVTPSANGCAGTPITYTYTVNPTSTVNAVSNQTVCNGAATSAVTFSGAVAGEVFSWTNNTTSIGLAAAGTGNIPSFTAVNTGTTPVTATVSVTANVPGRLNYTMYSTHGGNGNTSQYASFPNTAAEFDNLLNTANSNTTITSTGTADPASVIYWNGAGSLTAAGISVPNGGDYFAIKATGTFVAAETGTYTFAVDGDDAVDVAINGTVVCSYYGGHGFGGWHTGTIDLVAGTSYTFTARFQEFGGGEGINVAWMRPSQSAFALQADEFVGGCASAVRTFTITVNPTPTVAAVSNQTVCNGANTTAVTFAGAVTGTTYAWTNSNTAIGLAASGTGNIASFAGTNTTAAPITATITATPSANGCTGSPTSFTITVNPTATVNAIANQVLCKGSNTTAVTFAGPVAGTTYAWTNSNTAIGLAASGTGTGIASFATTNTTTAPLVATITVTPTANGCVGTPLTFTITVNPTPTVAAVSNQVLCHGSSTAAVTFAGTVTGTVFNWTNTNTSIGLAASGSGNIASFVATNTGSAQQVATITVTPSYTNGGVTCLGTPITFTITVNPLPVVSAGTLPSRICISDSLVALNGTPVGGYWTGIGTSGFNFVPNAAALGSYTLRYTFTDANNCTNSATIVATVNECIDRNKTLAAGAVTLFPNPNDGNFYLKVNSHLFNNLSMKVYNAAGQLVSTKQWSGVVYGRTMAVNLTNLPAGIYVVQLYYGDGQEAGAKVSYRIILGH